VFNHPFFAVTSKDGTFTIKGLPPGNYTIAAWQEKYRRDDPEDHGEGQGRHHPGLQV